MVTSRRTVPVLRTIALVGCGAGGERRGAEDALAFGTAPTAPGGRQDGCAVVADGAAGPVCSAAVAGRDWTGPEVAAGAGGGGDVGEACDAVEVAVATGWGAGGGGEGRVVDTTGGTGGGGSGGGGEIGTGGGGEVGTGTGTGTVTGTVTVGVVIGGSSASALSQSTPVRQATRATTNGLISM